MLCLTVLAVLAAGRAAAAPYNVEPDYEKAIQALGELSPTPSPETETQRQRREEEEERLEAIRRHILELLNMPCLPQPPVASSITIDNMRVFNQLVGRLQNESVSEREDLVKRSQSYYSSCDPPEVMEYHFWQEYNSINLFFNLTSFFLGLPEDVTIDVAELRLHKKPPLQNPLLFLPEIETGDEEEDQIRVSVYMYSVHSIPEAGSSAGLTYLVDWMLVPRAGQHWIKFNIRPAVRKWARPDYENMGLRVAVEDMDGNSLDPEDFFENMDCNGSEPGSPIPGYLLQVAREQQLPLHQKYHYPVLDLRTAEDADVPQLYGAAAASTAPCTSTSTSTPASYVGRPAARLAYTAGAPAIDGSLLEPASPLDSGLEPAKGDSARRHRRRHRRRHLRRQRRLRRRRGQH